MVNEIENITKIAGVVNEVVPSPSQKKKITAKLLNNLTDVEVEPFFKKLNIVPKVTVTNDLIVIDKKSKKVDVIEKKQSLIDGIIERKNPIVTEEVKVKTTGKLPMPEELLKKTNRFNIVVDTLPESTTEPVTRKFNPIIEETPVKKNLYPEIFIIDGEKNTAVTPGFIYSGGGSGGSSVESNPVNGEENNLMPVLLLGLIIYVMS